MIISYKKNAMNVVTPLCVSKMGLQEVWLWAVDARCASTVVVGWVWVVSAQCALRREGVWGGCGVLQQKILHKIVKVFFLIFFQHLQV